MKKLKNKIGLVLLTFSLVAPALGMLLWMIRPACPSCGREPAQIAYFWSVPWEPCGTGRFYPPDSLGPLMIKPLYMPPPPFSTIEWNRAAMEDQYEAERAGLWLDSWGWVCSNCKHRIY